MSEHPIQGLMDTTLEKIKQMVDINTIIGDPIITPDGTTIIPVSKITYGFASGGSEFANKQQPNANLFGGGGGAGGGGAAAGIGGAGGATAVMAAPSGQV